MADTEKDIADLRDATRLAHEAVQELKAATREGRLVIDEIKTAASVEVTERLETSLKTGLAELSESVTEAIEKATTAVYARFDTIADILMGETKTDKRRGNPSITDLAQQLKDKNDNE